MFFVAAVTFIAPFLCISDRIPRRGRLVKRLFEKAGKLGKEGAFCRVRLHQQTDAAGHRQTEAYIGHRGGGNDRTVRGRLLD